MSDIQPDNGNGTRYRPPAWLGYVVYTIRELGSFGLVSALIGLAMWFTVTRGDKVLTEMYRAIDEMQTSNAQDNETLKQFVAEQHTANELQREANQISNERNKAMLSIMNELVKGR
jgi:hypothetical protein